MEKASSRVIRAVHHEQASENTIYNAVYMFLYGRKTKKELAELFHKSPTTIANWIRKVLETGSAVRASNDEMDGVKFTAFMKNWIIEQYKVNPLVFFDECKVIFERTFGITISLSTIGRTLRDAGYTLKVVERRAIQIRYNAELATLPWNMESLVFIDESGMDNRDMLRKRGST
jgi:transposase